MNKNVKFSLVSLLFLLAGCKGSVSSSITESTNKVSSSVSSSEVSSSNSTISTSSSEVNSYGELIIPNMKIFMMKYMPLRGALSFGGGAIELTGIQGLLGMPEEE